MARAFLVVMDSVGIGGAPDAGRFFNGTTPDTGANTVGGDFVLEMGHQLSGAEQLFAPSAYAEHAPDSLPVVRLVVATPAGR